MWLINITHYINYILIVASLIAISIVSILVKKQSFQKLNPNKWADLNGLEFEVVVMDWLKLKGYSRISRTEYYDLGADIIATKGGQRYAVQVKRSSHKVGLNAIRAVHTSLAAYNCQVAMVVTNNYFTKNAVRLAKLNHIQLVDFNELYYSVIKIKANK